jgi:hypothetical protein
MELTLKKWTNLIPALFVVGLTYPVLYVLNLQDVMNGIFLKITTVVICIILFGFIAYPFVKGAETYKQGRIKLSSALFISGVLLPGASGVAAIVLIEYLRFSNA